MSRTTIFSLIAVVALALVVSFLLTSGGSTTTEVEQASSSDDTVTELTRTVDGLHQFASSNNTHTIAGTTTVPTPCHTLETEATVSSSTDPQEVTINFESVRADDNEMCAQVITETRFKLAVQAPENAEIIGGTFGADALNLNLREVPAGESLDDFEVYTKG